MKIYFIIILVILSFHSIAQTNSATIKGSLDFSNNADSVILTIFRHAPFDMNSISVQKTFNGKFFYKIKIDKSPIYISLKFVNKGSNLRGLNDIYSFLIERGDVIDYSVKDGVQVFSGIGGGRWKIEDSLIKIDNSSLRKLLGDGSIDSLSSISNTFKHDDSLLFLRLNLLFANRKLLGAAAYKLLLADAIGRSRWQKCFTAANNRAYKNNVFPYLSNYKEPSFNQYFSKSDSADVLPNSMSYSEGIIKQYQLDSCLKLKKTFSAFKTYNDFKSHYSGSLRDNLLTLLLYENRRKVNEDMSVCITDAINTINDTTLVNLLQAVSRLQFKSSIAYDFSLSDASGSTHHLSDYKGKMVVLDFWYNGCPGCAGLSPFLKKIESQFVGKSVVFLSINDDKNKSKWIAGVNSGIYTSPYTVNLFTEGLGWNHPVLKEFNITGNPTLVLIDKNGYTIRPAEDPRFDNGKDLIKIINDQIK